MSNIPHKTHLSNFGVLTPPPKKSNNIALLSLTVSYCSHFVLKDVCYCIKENQISGLEQDLNYHITKCCLR